MTTWNDGGDFLRQEWQSTVILKGKYQSQTPRPIYQSKAREKTNSW
jgi:hypothetical protein